LTKRWKIPQRYSGEFILHMEDVLEVYKRPYQADYPLICFDESSKQQIQELIEPLPMKEGKPKRVESSYERNGVSNLFMFFDPLKGKRRVKVTKYRKSLDFACCMKELVDEMYPKAHKIVVVMDNLNIHSLGSLYMAFEPAEAKRIIDRLEVHYTPKNGSWLNMAEIEFSALSRQCLKRRIPNRLTLQKEIKGWEKQRNKEKVKCDWQFTVDDARIKLKNLYPIYKKM
jgi:hypothetical protein